MMNFRDFDDTNPVNWTSPYWKHMTVSEYKATTRTYDEEGLITVRDDNNNNYVLGMVEDTGLTGDTYTPTFTPFRRKGSVIGENVGRYELPTKNGEAIKAKIERGTDFVVIENEHTVALQPPRAEDRHAKLPNSYHVAHPTMRVSTAPTPNTETTDRVTGVKKALVIAKDGFLRLPKMKLLAAASALALSGDISRTALKAAEQTTALTPTAIGQLVGVITLSFAGITAAIGGMIGLGMIAEKWMNREKKSSKAPEPRTDSPALQPQDPMPEATLTPMDTDTSSQDPTTSVPPAQKRVLAPDALESAKAAFACSNDISFKDFLKAYLQQGGMEARKSTPGGAAADVSMAKEFDKIGGKSPGAPAMAPGV